MYIPTHVGAHLGQFPKLPTTQLYSGHLEIMDRALRWKCDYPSPELLRRGRPGKVLIADGADGADGAAGTAVMAVALLAAWGVVAIGFPPRT